MGCVLVELGYLRFQKNEVLLMHGVRGTRTGVQGTWCWGHWRSRGNGGTGHWQLEGSRFAVGFVAPQVCFLFLLVLGEPVGLLDECVMKHGRVLCGGANGRNRQDRHTQGT